MDMIVLLLSNCRQYSLSRHKYVATLSARLELTLSAVSLTLCDVNSQFSAPLLHK